MSGYATPDAADKVRDAATRLSKASDGGDPEGAHEAADRALVSLCRTLIRYAPEDTQTQIEDALVAFKCLEKWYA